jgi:hypothetical protein
MRPGEKQTQVKSMNKNERQATFQNTKKKDKVDKEKKSRTLQ